MSEEQLKTFLAKIQADGQLQSKLNAVTSPSDVVQIAKDAGFMITAEELEKSLSSSDLSDDELENVAGGVAGPIGMTGWQGCGGQGPIGMTAWQGCGIKSPF